MNVTWNRPVVGILSVAVCLVAFVSFMCTEESSGGDAAVIPQDVLELATGVFSLFEMVFESDSSNPVLSTYPAGMAVEWVTEPTVLRIVLQGFTPDSSEMVVNGALTLSLADSSGSTTTVAIDGSLTMANHTYSSATIVGTAVYQLDGSDSSGSPLSVAGTFAVDGTGYDMAAIMAALTDDGGTTDPGVFTPLPAMYTSQTLHSRLQRSAPAALSDRWGESTYLSFVIDPDGAGYVATSTDGLNDGQGLVNWYVSGAQQKLSLTDMNRQPLYRFDVLEYDATHMRLQGEWGAETLEWLYSAGTGNLSGVVVDGSDGVLSNFSWYYFPIQGATVQYGTVVGMFEADTSIAACTTDSSGYFSFSGLGDPGSAMTGVRVVASGYQDQVQITSPQEPVSTVDNAFVLVSMTPQ